MKQRISTWLDNEQHLAYVILAPALTLLLGFAYYPAFQSFKFSMLRYNLKMPNRIKFNGFDNYIYVLKDPVFVASVLRVLYFMAIATTAVMLISLGISLVLNQRFKGRGILRAIVIIPWALPPVVNGHLWKWIFNGDYGALNGLLLQLGIIDNYHFWLNNSFVALNLAAFLFVWRYAPFVTILFLGVLQSVPGQLYEAAKVDGAGVFRQFYYITLASLSRIGGIAVILTLIASFNVFDGIYALMEFSESTKTPMIYNYELTFEMGRFGRGSAMAYLVGFFLFILTLIYIRTSFKKDKI
jgi:multiple sugar transport system permease protein